jgi:cellulose synthase/poly-beta-1,6-N-acetylglucosamine synthase-like glycosyltransferase
MKISFVIPAYNEENYIGECLRALLAEVKRCNFEVEIIVVNNNSTDKTGEIAASFLGVKVVDEPRKGLVQARHTGFTASTGDLIANVDADTKIPKGWIKKVLDEFGNDQKLAALSGPYVYYDLPFFTSLVVKVFYFFGYMTYVFNRFVFKKSGMIQGGNFVLRRSALEKIGGFNTNIDFYGEDTDIARRMQKTGKVKFTFDLPMYTSGRRIMKEGIVKTGFRYAINYFWMLIFSRPFSKTYSDVRIKVN